MKNIHVLPTDKPSRVRIGNNGNFVIGLTQSATASKNDSYTNQHIYITSDEEIKEGDYFIAYSVTIDKKPYISCASEYKERKKEKGKIILTTDQDLINDGVQAIEDGFLEWFVNNPSCEWVEIQKGFEDGTSYGYNFLDYKIIIPKEEPKQETLEEFIQRQLSLGKYQDQESAIRNSIELTAKWQQEQDKNKYSEDEVLDILFTMSVDNPNNITKWFEQFKNK